MADVVRFYLAECSRRHIEPFYGFIENVNSGAIEVDLDFVSLDSIRVMTHCMSSARSDLITNGALLSLGIFHGSRKREQHAPVRSSAMFSYPKLLQKYPVTSLQTVTDRIVNGFATMTRSYASTIATLQLAGIDIGPAGAKRIAEALGLCFSLRKLNINGAQVEDTGFSLIVSSVKNASLEELHARNNSLTDDSSKTLQALIASGRPREQLKRFESSLRPQSSSLTDADRKSSSLRMLDLGQNLLGDQALSALGSVLLHDESLRTIDLAENSFSSKAACNFVAAVERAECSAVSFVDLSRNGNLDVGQLQHELQALSCISHGSGQVIVVRQISHRPAEIVPLVRTTVHTTLNKKASKTVSPVSRRSSPEIPESENRCAEKIEADGICNPPVPPIPQGSIPASMPMMSYWSMMMMMLMNPAMFPSSATSVPDHLKHYFSAPPWYPFAQPAAAAAARLDECVGTSPAPIPTPPEPTVDAEDHTAKPCLEDEAPVQLQDLLLEENALNSDSVLIDENDGARPQTPQVALDVKEPRKNELVELVRSALEEHEAAVSLNVERLRQEVALVAEETHELRKVVQQVETQGQQLHADAAKHARARQVVVLAQEPPQKRPEDVITDELVQLVQTGLRKIANGLEGDNKHSSGSTATASKQADQPFAAVVTSRLAELGW